MGQCQRRREKSQRRRKFGASRASHLPSEHWGTGCAGKRSPAPSAAAGGTSSGGSGCSSEGCGSSPSACIGSCGNSPRRRRRRRRRPSQHLVDHRSGSPAPTWPCSAVAAPGSGSDPDLLDGGTCCDARDLGGSSLSERQKSKHRSAECAERREAQARDLRRRRPQAAAASRPLASPRSTEPARAPILLRALTRFFLELVDSQAEVTESSVWWLGLIWSMSLALSNQLCGSANSAVDGGDPEVRFAAEFIADLRPLTPTPTLAIRRRLRDSPERRVRWA